MVYTINKISKMSGVSTRTLRYYDEIGLLKPARVTSSGYRIYGQKEVDSLINNVTKSIAAMKGDGEMSDKEKFEGFKTLSLMKTSANMALKSGQSTEMKP